MDEGFSVGEKIVLHKETAVEFDWWGDEIIENEKEGLDQNKLIKVSSTGKSFRLIGILRGEKEPKSARPGVEQVLEEVGSDWRQVIEEKGIVDDPHNWFISITSLYRDNELEDKFEELPNSNSRSSHEMGAAFDIDARGFYYLNPETGEYEGVNINNEGSEELRRQLSLVLYEILQKKDEQKKINFFPEYNPSSQEEAKSTLGCYHCCLSPDYQKKLLE